MPPRGKKPPPIPRRPGQEVRQEISGPQELLIGRAVVVWSRLEQAIEEVIWAFLRISVEDGRIITARLDAKYRLNMLRALGEKHMDKESFSVLSDLIKRINDLYERRNLIVHGIWVTILPEGVPAVLSLREKLPDDANRNEVMTTLMPSQDMNGVIDHIMLVTNLLIRYREIAESPDKHVPPP